MNNDVLRFFSLLFLLFCFGVLVGALLFSFFGRSFIVMSIILLFGSVLTSFFVRLLED